jgi:hypothetical protein
MKSDRATVLAAAQIIFGIIIFTSAWWLSYDQHQTALYIFGFITVLMGIVTGVLLTAKK